MGDRSPVIWAKLGHAEPLGGWDGSQEEGGQGSPPPQFLPCPLPPSLRAGPSRDSNQTHNTVSFLART